MHIPTGKAALSPPNKNTRSCNNTFSFEDSPVESTVLINNAKNNLNLEEEYILMLSATEISYFSVLPMMRRKMLLEL